MKMNCKILVICLATLLSSLSLGAELPADAVWIDVRTPEEFEQGHLARATLIPYDGIEKGVAALNLPKNTPIYLHCAVGGRSEIAKQRLEAIGYSKVTNVGGLADAEKLIAEQ